MHPSGLPGDGIDAALRSPDRRTSPTNVAGWLWSLVATRELALVAQDAGTARIRSTLAALRRLPRHTASGMFFNWYDAPTVTLATGWQRGKRSQPFVSSVDNAWLSGSLMLVREAVEELRGECEDLLAAMDWSVFVSPGSGDDAPLHGGFWVRRTRRRAVRSRVLPDGSTVELTPHRYDLLNSETRILSLVAMAAGQRAPTHLSALLAPSRAYLGRSVVATWGGSMFEALSPLVLVPEVQWAPLTWGHNHVVTAELHAAHAAGLGYAQWGFSPSCRPGPRGYTEYGVPPIAAGAGYPVGERGDPVVTPHAAGLALQVIPDAAMQCLSSLAERPGVYGPGGFVDAVGLRSGRVAPRHLVLDQAMLLGGLANHVTGGALQQGFSSPAVSRAVRPAVADANLLPTPATWRSAARDTPGAVVILGPCAACRPGPASSTQPTSGARRCITTAGARAPARG